MRCLLTRLRHEGPADECFPFLPAEWSDEAVPRAEILRLIYQGQYWKEGLESQMKRQFFDE